MNSASKQEQSTSPEAMQMRQSPEQCSPSAPPSNRNESEAPSDTKSPSEITNSRHSSTTSIAAHHPRKQPMLPRRESISQLEADSSGIAENVFEQDSVDQEQQAKRRKVEDQMSSCETCKHRKVKCDRTQPSCFRCQRSKQECVYKQKKKPGLRAGIGRELEERLDRVESMLASHAQLLKQQTPKSHQLHSQSNASSRSHISSPGSPLISSLYHDQARHASSSMASGCGYIPGRAMTHIDERESSESPANSGSAGIYHIRGHNSGHMDIDLPGHFSQGQRTSDGVRSFDPELPPDNILLHLIELYFDHIHPSVPILHRETIINTYFPRSTSEYHPDDIVLLFAIASAALRFSTDRRIDENYKKTFTRSAKQKVIFNAMENPSVQSLRSMVITVIDVVGSTNGPAGWGLIAFTSRMAMHLGLNTEPSNSPVYGLSGNDSELPAISTWGVGTLPESKDWIEQEGRRRLFWAVYNLDIYTSLGTSLDLTLDEKEIERLLPCQDKIWDSNQPTTTRWFRNPCQEVEINITNMHTLSSFSFLVEIMGLLGQIHQFLRKTIDINNLDDVNGWQTKYRSLDKALSNWKYSLPMQFGNLTRALTLGPRTFEPGWVLLHAAYNTAVIRLHSVAAYPTNRSALFGPSYSAGQRCLSAVENVAALTRIVLDNNMLSQLGSTFAFTLWASARLILVHASTTEYPMIPDIRLFLNALNEMGRIYETAGRYASILQRVIDELAEATGDQLFRQDRGMSPNKAGSGCGGFSPKSQSGSPEANSRNNSCVEILADMRRTAFAVDVLISQQSSQNKAHPSSGSFQGAFGVNSLSGSAYSPPITQTTMHSNSAHNLRDGDGQGQESHLHAPPGPLSPNPHIASIPAAGSHPNGIHHITPNPQTIEYLDVFNWFNFPRVAGPTTNLDGGTNSAMPTNSTNTPIQGFQTLESHVQSEHGHSAGDWHFRT
ncbi:fungal-specific transcription factor domain-containing protein [Peziza echinospora]|nr:fungal-specific transcription factor domain-containing protein [Peziza echinospora]